MSRDLRDRLEAILRAAPDTWAVLETLRALALPDGLLFSGAVYQPVLNHLTGRAADHGVKDYDVAYFDAADTSYDGEDAVIQRVSAAFEPPLRGLVEVRNQARVHLWFNDRFGAVPAYPALSSSGDALNRFVCTAFCVGVRLEPGGGLTILAPFGLEDLFALRLRANPRRATGVDDWARITGSVVRRWPEVAVID